MQFISLFAGIGGFDLGFARAGMECAAHVEKDAAASRILARHFPNAQHFEDVTDVGQHNLPSADVICGGFPCQDVSVAGRRAGLAGARSGLWFEFHRILKELKPQFAVIENVPGLLSSNSGRDFATILSGLEELGYFVAWRVLDAQYFGVAQRRRRLFVVASLGDGRSAQILFESNGSERYFETGTEARQAVATLRKSASQGNRAVYGLNGELNASYELVGTLQAGSSSGSGTSAMIVSLEECRQLTPLEWERLQGFPDNYTIEQTDRQRRRQLGNAVCVNVAEWLGQRLVEVGK